MCATSSDRSMMGASRGFTMIELIVVMVVVGVLAVSVVPQFTAALSLRDEGWRDEVLSALRYAQKSSVAHRRLVCASVASDAVTLTIAVANPATSCGGTPLPGPDGGAEFASTGGSPGTAVSPSGTMYFQPDGRVTTDGAGTTSSTFTVSMSGGASITVNGETGYVE